MVGANYMGGKRNTARVKSKDVVGRAQRRHFGKQRLVSALCVAQGKRVHSNTETSSSLPEITLAHARRDITDSGATSSRRVSRDELLNLPSSLSNTTQRKKPSKVLGALDTSDQDLSMRAAIDRILQQSNLLGINTEKLGEIAPVERMQSPATVARSTQTCLTPKKSDASETASKQGIDTPATLAEIERTSFREPDQNTRHWSPESDILSQPDYPPEIRDVKSQRRMDNSRYTETQMFTGVHTFFRAEGQTPDVLLDSLYPLPRSSPFASSSQSSNSSLLDLDTSPFTGIPFGRRPNDQSEDSCMDTRNFHPIPRLCPSSQSFSLRDCPVNVDEAQSTILSFTNSDEEELGAEQSDATCYDKNPVFSSTANDEFRDPFPSECRCDTFQIVMGSEVTENDVPNGISINFLSDPHPWETIGRILDLEPPELPAAQFSTINFTNNREGVGYVSRKKSDACNACLSDTTFFEARIGNNSEDNTCVVSTTDPLVLPNTDPGIGDTNGCLAVDAAESPCVDSSTVPLPDQEPSGTAANAFVMPQGTPAVHCTKKADIRPASPRTTAVEASAPESEMIFAGPCLFGDSDLEEDE